MEIFAIAALVAAAFFIYVIYSEIVDMIHDRRRTARIQAQLPDGLYYGD
jgi:hypothetical protein